MKKKTGFVHRYARTDFERGGGVGMKAVRRKQNYKRIIIIVSIINRFHTFDLWPPPFIFLLIRHNVRSTSSVVHCTIRIHYCGTNSTTFLLVATVFQCYLNPMMGIKGRFLSGLTLRHWATRSTFFLTLSMWCLRRMDALVRLTIITISYIRQCNLHMTLNKL